MSDCSRPLDPLDIEALASGAAPLVQEDASRHAASCAACGASVARARSLEGLIDAVARAGAAPADLADRVLRVRPFSRAERWSPAVWRAPVLLLTALGGAGTVLIGGASAGPREQVGLGAAMLASAAGLVRASWRWISDLSQAAPSGASALSEMLRATPAGWAALLLLPAAALGLRRVLSRAFARR